MIDRELVTRKTVLILEDLRAVEKLAGRDREQYLESDVDKVLAERYLERMIGRMIDVNYHLLTESGQPPPRDYYQAFVDLGPLGVMDSDLARRLASCAGLRNRIAHEYDTLDHALIYESLHTAVADIPLYLERVRAFLDRSG